MKYIEEISNGDCFIYNDKYFILTVDFKKDGTKLAISLYDGMPKWFKSNTIVEIIDIFTINKDNNIIAIRERKQDAVNSNKNIP